MSPKRKINTIYVINYAVELTIFAMLLKILKYHEKKIHTFVYLPAFGYAIRKTSSVLTFIFIIFGIFVRESGMSPFSIALLARQ